MSSVQIAEKADGLTRVTWKTQICGTEENEIVTHLKSFHPAESFKVLCSYKLASGCIKAGPCVFNVWLTLTPVDVERKNSCVPDYCYKSPCVWGNVLDRDNLGDKHFFQKSPISQEWKSKMFVIKFNAKPEKSKSVGYYAVGINHYMNTLLLNCEVWIQFEISVSRSEIKVVKQLTDLFITQNYCDVKFCFGNNQRIGGHIAILASRSPVFAAMFQHNMKENQSGQVEIHDVKSVIFHQLLHYIYSGRLSTPLSEEDAQPLYVAADKYDIDDLKEKCVNFLLTRFRLDNSIHLLAWAHLHSIHKIQEAALDFIAVNGKEICFIDDWKKLITNYPDLCLIATQRMMTNMNVISSKPKNH